MISYLLLFIVIIIARKRPFFKGNIFVLKNDGQITNVHWHTIAFGVPLKMFQIDGFITTKLYTLGFKSFILNIMIRFTTQ